MRTPEEIKEYKRQWYLDNRERTKERAKELKKIYRAANIEKIKAQSKEYHARTKEKVKEYRELNKEKIKETRAKFRLENKEMIRERESNRQRKRREDPLYKFKDAIRNTIRRAMKTKGNKKNSKSWELLGCTFDEFRKYIEDKFELWMTWDNHGNPIDGIIEPDKSWDLDHIIPMASAKTEEEIIRLNHYSNFQPLCSYINRHVKRDIMN